jgi:predicted dienelactone hydrolase
MDKVDSSRTYVTHTNSRKVNTVRDRLAQKVTVNGAQGILDLFQSAVDANLLTIDGDNYKYRAKVRVGYPADPANLSKAATPAVSTQKYPLVVILHGRADSWIQSGSPIDTGKVAASGHKVFTIALTNQRNHAGYDYLQKWLAEPGRAMVSVSIETNITNQLDLLTKMRAQIVIDVLTELEKRSATDPIFSKVDFQNIGLMGHSRGGEA